MLSLEQIIKNTKQKYRFNTLQIRNVLKKLAFLTGVSYFKKKKEELKRGGWRWGECGCQGRNAEIKTDQAQLLQINHSKRFPLPQGCFD